MGLSSADLREIKGCIISTFNDKFLQDVVSKVAAMVDKQLEEKLKAQDVEIETLKENQNKIIEENMQLRKIIDDQEQHARNLNVRIHGIKVDGENTENLRTKVLEVFTNKLKINLVDSVIKKCHRVSSMGPSDQPPAVLVRFASDTSRSQDRFKFTILNAVLVANKGDLAALVDSEARVMLLYCTKEEAIDILTAASDLHLTGENYVWVVTQSVIETSFQAPYQFPVGMLDSTNRHRSLTTHLSCEGEGAARWDTGDQFFKYLRNVSVEADQGRPNLEFTPDGVLRAAELKIMNLRPGVSKQLVWEEIGVWKSWQKEGLDIKDIVWPGNSHTPPQGVPEKFHLKITFLEEPPYIKLAPPDPVTGKCSMDRGVLCRVASDEAITE
ncbi:unnamed protein product [Ceutorhynchus assimilis]|uniref:Uncharacterized protein n=1 Tax=Ceutorhynchus assimilis TaxID=467358 RepID=A0A9N9M9W9_9CUCU|nr:unnamed protein product [Ceutorhynchus assimilis]